MIEVIAHRGDSAQAPENTLAAFRWAWDEGIRWVELDVRACRDGEPVVIHDAAVDRTTNGKGRVRDMALEELARLDAGSWFHPSFSGERVPRLADVLAAMPAGACLDVEIKAGGCRGQEMSRLVRAVLQAIAASGRRSSILLTSFSLDVIRCARSVDPDIAVGLLSHRSRFLPHLLRVLVENRMTAYFQNVLTVSKPLVRHLREEGIAVGVFTVNSERSLRHAVRCGVRYIVTDDPVTICGTMKRFP